MAEKNLKLTDSYVDFDCVFFFIQSVLEDRGLRKILHRISS